MADMATALKGGYADQFKAMLRNPNIPENSLLTRAIHGGAGLVDAYNAWDAPDATTMQGALKYGAMPAKAAVGMGKGMLDVLKGAMDNPEDSMKMLDLASMVAGGGFGASKLAGVPKGSLGANVWQGGPHKYGPKGASESLQHMSTGEGAQAYGWGRYDAGAEKVGQQYKDDVTRGAYEIGGDVSHTLTTKLDADAGVYAANAVSRFDSQRNPFEPTKHTVLKEDVQKAVDWLEDWGTDAEAKKILQKSLDSGEPIKVADGYLYKHDLPDDDIARYLDWDAPLSEQSDVFWDAVDSSPELGKLVDDVEYAKRIKATKLGDDATGADFYQALSQNHNKQAASEALGRAGIPGLKYYDGMNRGMPYKVQPMYKGKPYSDPIDAHGSQVQGLVDDYKAKGFDVDVTEGTRNYVTWDQDVLNRMKLLERNGESMTDALTGTK